MGVLSTFTIASAIEFLQDNEAFFTPEHTQALQRLKVWDKAESEPIDLLTEITCQLSMLRDVRLRLMSKPEDFGAKDFKDLVVTTGNMFSMFTKLQAEIVNQKRLKMLEYSTIEAVKTLPKEAQEIFFAEWERLLEANSPA